MFLQCHAAADSGSSYGGAIYHCGRGFHTELSCFHGVTSKSFGSAIYTNQPEGTPSVVASSTFLFCGGSSFNCQGTVFEEREVDFTYQRLNFSFCRVTSDGGSSGGAVFKSLNKDSSVTFTWSFLECNICNCSGRTGIDSWTRFGQFLAFCNLFDNSMSVIVLWVGYTGMTLQNCIFMGNTKECDPNSGNSRFTVTNCVFSGPLPSGNYDWLTPDNVFDSIAASFTYSYFFTEQCRTPSRSRSPTATNSNQFTESIGPFSESHPFADSLSLTPSLPLHASAVLVAIRTDMFTSCFPAYIHRWRFMRTSFFNFPFLLQAEF
jgi:hypothetical protein